MKRAVCLWFLSLLLALFAGSGCGDSAACQEEADSRDCLVEEIEGEEAAATERSSAHHQQAAAPSRAQLAREVAREVCALSTQAELAKEFGVPNELGPVLNAWGEGSTPDARVSSEQGCLEGLSE